jgi:hypothetical protein
MSAAFEAALGQLVLIERNDLATMAISYGFRPGRGTHDALDALCVAIDSRKVSWILDATLRHGEKVSAHPRECGLMPSDVADYQP